jgi:hypothetical protein
VNVDVDCIITLDFNAEQITLFRLNRCTAHVEAGIGFISVRHTANVCLAFSDITSRIYVSTKDDKM